MRRHVEVVELALADSVVEGNANASVALVAYLAM